MEQAFRPQEWWKIIGDEEKCYRSPHVAIGRLDGLYGTVGLGLLIVKRQVMGLFNMTAPSGTNPNPEAIDITSKMFFAENNAAGVFQIAFYFAGYQSRFKSKRSYQSFDTGDILSAYRSNFIPYWQQLAARFDDRDRRQVQTSREPTGEDALAVYVYRQVERYGGGEHGIDEFMKHSGMVSSGLLTRAKIKNLLRLANKPY